MTRLSSLLSCVLLCDCAPEGELLRFEATRNPHDPFGALVEVVFDAPGRARVEIRADGDIERTTPAIALAAGVPETLVVRGLQADRTFDLRVVFGSMAMPWCTGPIPTVASSSG